MGKFIRHKTVINYEKIYYYTDEEGTEWYPFTKTFKKILLTSYRAKDFTKTSYINYMIKVFLTGNNDTEVISPKQTWLINRKGVCLFLKHVSPKDSDRNIKNKKVALYNTCKYFGVKREVNINKMYNVIEPEKKDYDDWTNICFDYDEGVKNSNIWKSCIKCNKYFPESVYYYRLIRKKNEKYSNECLKCEGEDFICKNKDLQTLHNLNQDKIIAAIRKKNPLAVYRMYLSEHLKVELNYFYNRYNILCILRHLEKALTFDNNNLYITNIAKMLNLNPHKLAMVLKDYFDIGYDFPNKKHGKIDKGDFIRLCRENFASVISGYLFKPIYNDAVVGIMTKNKLIIVSEEMHEGGPAKVFKLPALKNEALALIKKIKKIEGLKDES